MADQASVRRVRERLAADGLATGPGYPARKVTRIMAGPVCVIGAVTSPIPLLAFPTPLAVAVVASEVVGGGLLFWVAGRGRLTRHGRARRRMLRDRALTRTASAVVSPCAATRPPTA
ncbi:hypothetical protein [Yinghuangia sp. YIM S09857]|uniref:hypothetical protein n=1 Tax=Yinghuangia sp. YIM S09857 TaxID=3436929 RepID=UPI003F52BA7A